MDDVKILLGQRIKELRKHLNISQQELAEMINIDQRNLSNIETGRSFPSKSLTLIADSLGVTLPELFDFEHIATTHEGKINFIHDKIKSMSDDKINFVYRLIKTFQ